MQGDYPVWWDGFSNVVIGGETSDWMDNVYLKEIDSQCLKTELDFTRERDLNLNYKSYEAGAIAGESLIKHP